VFCAFNNTYKFSPEVFDIWMRLLLAVEDSVLWLSSVNDAARGNLILEAGARGVSAARLIFAPYVASGSDHLARLSLADLFLDTRPYNAHSSATDALWAGVPVLTHPSDTFAGRVGASLVRACGLDELIADTAASYEETALRLARDAAAHVALKEKLRRNLQSCPLFNTAAFTRHLETAYTIMWESHERGLEPHGFGVARIPA
jgi:predicted O-linked N-acetylglucosamine transferase (SPINDLY family)